jgi:hypothetical protein
MDEVATPGSKTHPAWLPVFLIYSNPFSSAQEVELCLKSQLKRPFHLGFFFFFSGYNLAFLRVSNAKLGKPFWLDTGHKSAKLLSSMTRKEGVQVPGLFLPLHSSTSTRTLHSK